MVRPPREHNLVGGSAALIAGRIAVAMLSYASTAAIARTLSGDDWGAFTLIFSISTIAGAVFDLQASRLVLQDLADPEVDSGRTVGSYMTLRFALGLAGYVLAVAVVMLGDFAPAVQRGMVLGGTVLLLAPTWSGLFVYFQAQYWFRTVSLVSVASRLLLVVLTTSLIVSGTRSVVWFLVPSLAAEAFILVALLVVASRHLRIRPVVEVRRWTAWLRETLPIVLGAAIGTVYFRLDAVMLAQLDDLRAVGLYGVAYKFADLMAVVPTAVMAPTFTLLVGTWPGDRAVFWRNFRGALVLLIVTAFYLTAAFSAFASPLVTLLYGHRYAGAAGAARLVVLGQAVRFFTVLCTCTLIAVRRNALYAIASIAGLGVNIALNVYLIPRHSYGGAAIATVVTEVAVLAVLVVAIRQIEGVIRFPWAVLGRVALATGILLVVAGAADAVVPWPVAAVLATVGLLLSLHVLGIEGTGGLRAVPDLLAPVASTPPSGPSELDGVSP